MRKFVPYKVKTPLNPVCHQPIHRQLANLLFLCLFPLLGLLAMEGAARGGITALLQWVWLRPLPALWSLLLLCGVYWLFSIFRSDRLRACFCLLTTTLLFGIGIASYYKIYYRYEPVLISDLWQLQDMNQALTHMDLTIRWEILLAAILLCTALMTLCFFFLPGVRKRRSFLWPLAGIAFWFILLPHTTLGNPILQHQTDLPGYANESGTLYTAISVENLRHISRTATYTDQEITDAYHDIASLALPDEPNPPNIIFVLYESFADQKYLSQGLNFTKTLMPFYESLRSQSATGCIYVPKIGGGTSETEYEVLTGLKSSYGYTPYSMGLPQLHSVAATLRERGYTSRALHWFTGVFYNRYFNLKQLGFDELHTTDTTMQPFQKIGQYNSDEDHFSSALTALEQTKERDFLFLLTMQNHGPYGYDDFSATYQADTPFTNTFTSETQNILRNYCYLLSQSDLALKKFITSLEALEEPTMVVFFSDHIPPFGEDVYQEINIDISGEKGHMAPYFIWSNQGCPVQEEDMQAWQLSGYALSLAGIHSDPFFYYIETMRKNGLHEDERYQILSHDAMFGRQLHYSEADFSILSEKWQIGGEMCLSGFSASQVDDSIFIVPLLANTWQSYQLLVNGQVVDDCRMLPTRQPFSLQCIMKTPSGKFLNESRIFTFSSTDDLLAQSQRLQTQAIDISQDTFQIYRDAPDHVIFFSRETYLSRVNCLTLDGKRYEWQPLNKLQKEGQYSLSLEQSPLFISIAKTKDVSINETNICAFLKEHAATLYLFDEWAPCEE